VITLQHTCTITISGSISSDSAKPVQVAWSITAGPDDTRETLAQAIATVCQQMQATLTGALK